MAPLPHLGSAVDDVCLVRSMYSEHNNHTEGLVLLNTGKIFPGRPARGSWVSYGLGTENQNLPGLHRAARPGGLQHQRHPPLAERLGCRRCSAARRSPRRASPCGTCSRRPPCRRKSGADEPRLLARSERGTPQGIPARVGAGSRGSATTNSRRGCSSRPGAVLDLSKESGPTGEVYGLDDPMTAGYGLRCLMARRLVESGVRFVQVFPPVKPQSQPWDAHNNVKLDNEAICADGPPLRRADPGPKARGFLESTIVLWSGEFGRLPVSQNGPGGTITETPSA